MDIVIGNILALIASILFMYAGILKNKGKILITQSIQKALSATSNIILKGYSGAIMHTLSIINYMLCYFGKLTIPIKIIMTITITTLTIIFNNLGIIGYLPLVSSITYLWLMDIKDIIKFKYLLLFTIVLWAIYDLTIKSYTSLAFGIVAIFTNVISIIQIRKKQKENNIEEK